MVYLFKVIKKFVFCFLFSLKPGDAINCARYWMLKHVVCLKVTHLFKLDRNRICKWINSFWFQYVHRSLLRTDCDGSIFLFRTCIRIRHSLTSIVNWKADDLLWYFNVLAASSYMFAFSREHLTIIVWSLAAFLTSTWKNVHCCHKMPFICQHLFRWRIHTLRFLWHAWIRQNMWIELNKKKSYWWRIRPRADNKRGSVPKAKKYNAKNEKKENNNNLKLSEM